MNCTWDKEVLRYTVLTLNTYPRMLSTLTVSVAVYKSFSLSLSCALSPALVSTETKFGCPLSAATYYWYRTVYCSDEDCHEVIHFSKASLSIGSHLCLGQAVIYYKKTGSSLSLYKDYAVHNTKDCANSIPLHESRCIKYNWISVELWQRSLQNTHKHK